VFTERILPTGSFDVVCVQPGAAEQLGNAGLLEKLDERKIPNLKRVLPNLRISEFMAPHIYSPTVLIYNPQNLPEPPKSLGDLLDPKYRGKFAVTDANFTIVVLAAALYAGGDIHSIDKGKAFVEKLNGNGLKFYSADMMAAPLQTGEISVGLLPLARVVMWQNQGLDIRPVFPTEGSIPYIDGMSIPKNAPNKEGAYKYVDVMLGAKAQQIFADLMGYLPSIDNADLTGGTASRLALPNPPPKIVLEDYAFSSSIQESLGEWWKKSILVVQ
jgi:putative spermidine/putrescine transport system substrate-binding protein